jgi:hypothetical protein
MMSFPDEMSSWGCEIPSSVVAMPFLAEEMVSADEEKTCMGH